MSSLRRKRAMSRLRRFSRRAATTRSGRDLSKIRQSVLDATAAGGSLFGWQLVHYPKGNYIAVNVPVSTTEFQQHVMNTETKAWCRFTGQQATCWGLYNDALYYGKADGTVVLADSGTADLSTIILVSAQTAWNYLGNNKRPKRLSALRLSLRRQAATLGYTVGVAFDYRQLLTSINQTIVDSSGATWLTWEANPWDTQPWGAGDFVSNQWCSASNSGYACSISLQLSLTTQRVEWFATTYLVEQGGIV
jgi:hypothetical protein